MKASVIVLSRDEPALANTLDALEALTADGHEVVVVDASGGRLDHIRVAHAAVRWLEFIPPSGVRVSIPHQRNLGVQSASHGLIVFLDAGCVPVDDWWDRLCAPITRDGEDVACGAAVSPDRDIYGGVAQRGTSDYLVECPTINLALRRAVYDAVGGFDESFEYGSDIDLSWRVVASGYRIRNVPTAVVVHPWGGTRRQIRRAYAYGQARTKLYFKHADRRRQVMQRDPVLILYPVFVLGLPLALVRPSYLLLLALPLWRNRRQYPFLTTVDHLAYGFGALRECKRQLRRLRP
jgi:GT2 family glycosyltransferase